MKLDTLLEVLWASTMTHRVRTKFSSRGGIFLVSPPGQLKTSLLGVFEEQLGVVGYSDLTTTQLVEARDLICSNKIHSIMLYDAQKIYERRADTAANIMGNIRALMDEGFTTASFERVSKNVMQQRARALVLAALTPQFYRAQYAQWEQDGLVRRAIFCSYVLKNPERIQRAILEDKPIEILSPMMGLPVGLEIDGKLRDGDDELIMKVLRRQGESVNVILMKKILSVLRWKYTTRLKKADRSHEILMDFSEGLGGEGAQVTL